MFTSTAPNSSRKRNLSVTVPKRETLPTLSPIRRSTLKHPNDRILGSTMSPLKPQSVSSAKRSAQFA